ncbi:MAG: hypothetical protein UV95_C0001G0223 [Candidatus Falkowbacteria bacterium GW2011_GWF2_43_32]|nr:MAG: hypothetical protein UV95_C0001G0223 [Candidatus Falkowbacteria bacterium GW2011_GWF2_43_32]
MNKIKSLFDVEFVRDLFTREVLPLYPKFVAINRIKIKPYKNMIWETTYHVVIGFDVYFVKGDGRETKVPLVCSAHSSEPRQNVHLCLQYLWKQKFPNGAVNIPKPLFYSAHFNGTFYRAVKGNNLLYYIRKRKFSEVKKIIIAAAGLFARLHALPANPEANFNFLNSRIKTVIPGTEFIFREMAERYQNKYNADLSEIYSFFIAAEEKFFLSRNSLTLIHGDAHPENIIRTGIGKIGLIDFTDFCLGDFARDLGTFLQQLEYKLDKKDELKFASAEMRKLFLDTYLAISGRSLTAELQARIDLYYNWMAMRTAIYWFLKFGHNEERAEELLKKVKNNLKL